MVTDNRFLPAPDDLHRSLKPTLLQPPGRQRQHDLHRHILPAAKSPANGRVNDPHLFHRQPQSMRNLFLVFMRPLTSHLNRNAPFDVNIPQACLWLKISMFLGRRAVLPFDHDIGLGKGGFYVPFADAIVDHDIGAPLRVQQFSFWQHCCQRVGDHRQIIVFHFDHVASLCSDLLRLSHHQRHLIPHKTNPIGKGLA